MKQPDSVQNLDYVQEGRALRVVSVDGAPALRRRLAAIGIRSGTRLRVVHRVGPGRVVVRIGFGTIALGDEVVCHVAVAPDEDQK